MVGHWMLHCVFIANHGGQIDGLDDFRLLCGAVVGIWVLFALSFAQGLLSVKAPPLAGPSSFLGGGCLPHGLGDFIL